MSERFLAADHPQVSALEDSEAKLSDITSRFIVTVKNLETRENELAEERKVM